MIPDKYANRDLCWELPLDVGTGTSPLAQLACTDSTPWVCSLCLDSTDSSRFRNDFQHLLEMHDGILFSKNKVLMNCFAALDRKKNSHRLASIVIG